MLNWNVILLLLLSVKSRSNSSTCCKALLPLKMGGLRYGTVELILFIELTRCTRPLQNLGEFSGCKCVHWSTHDELYISSDSLNG